MPETKLTLQCMFCEESTSQTITLPEGWEGHGSIYDEGFCNKHKAAKSFLAEQCPGCISAFSECEMQKAMQHSTYQRKPAVITEQDFVIIESGICPKRYNGSSYFDGSTFSPLNLSKVAPVEAGLAMAAAMRDYMARDLELKARADRKYGQQ